MVRRRPISLCMPDCVRRSVGRPQSIATVGRQNDSVTVYIHHGPHSTHALTDKRLPYPPICVPSDGNRPSQTCDDRQLSVYKLSEKNSLSLIRRNAWWKLHWSLASPIIRVRSHCCIRKRRIFPDFKLGIVLRNVITLQGSNTFSLKIFHDFSMTFHDPHGSFSMIARRCTTMHHFLFLHNNYTKY